MLGFAVVRHRKIQGSVLPIASSEATVYPRMLSFFVKTIVDTRCLIPVLFTLENSVGGIDYIDMTTSQSVLWWRVALPRSRSTMSEGMV